MILLRQLASTFLIILMLCFFVIFCIVIAFQRVINGKNNKFSVYIFLTRLILNIAIAYLKRILYVCKNIFVKLQ